MAKILTAHKRNVLALVILLDGTQRHDFKKGDKVLDLTAKRFGLKDVNGVVERVSGPMVSVKYASGHKRWKLHVNIRRIQKVRKK